MNTRHIFFKIIFSVWMVFNINLAEAHKPVWTFEPLTATTIVVSPHDTATVQYTVTNQSKKHTLVLQAVPGITQITGNGYCANPFTLARYESCTLTLAIQGANLARNVSGGPIVCEGGNPNECYQPDLPFQLRITKSPLGSFTVGGDIFGLSGTLVLQNNGGDALIALVDGSFTFSSPLLSGSSYSVTVQSQPATQTCTVSNGTGTITNSNVTNVMVNCSINTHMVGGTTTGLGLGESVVLQNNGGDNLLVNANGAFTFSTPVAQGAAYNVTILTQPATQFCTIINGSGIVGGSDITNVQLTCATNAYTVGGTVSGLIGTVTLQNNGADNLSINADGAFTFSTPVAEGAPYNVTVLTQPGAQICSVTNGSGTMGGANVTNLGITCVTQSTTLNTMSDLALSVTGHTEYGLPGTPTSGLPRIITITNTGSFTALNLAITAPVWPTGTINSTTCSSTLAAGNSCTVTVTPGAVATSDGTNPCSVGTAPVPGVVQVTADNANSPTTNVVILDYGCIYQGGYVFAFDDTTVNTTSVAGSVATTSNQAQPSPNGIVWSSNGNGGSSADVANDSIYGVSSSSTVSTPDPATGQVAGQVACNGSTDGACNTNNIYVYYQSFATNSPINLAFYATGLCKQTISGFSDWFLPSICEMGYGAFCGGGNPVAPTRQNMRLSLVDYNGLNLLSGSFWSSSENSSIPTSGAVFTNFSNNFQSVGGKATQFGVRCARHF